MSDQKKIVEDIFAQQRKKQQKNQKGKPAETAQKAGAKKGEAEEKKDDVKATPQTQSQQQDFAESSDEETKIELDDKAVIKDAKEVEALKRKENEKDNKGFGWGGLEKVGQTNVKSTDAPVQSKASGAGGMEIDGLKSAVASRGQANITFKNRPPTFNKSKGAINEQEFPELGEKPGQKSAEPSSKKDSTYSGQFSSTIASGKPKPTEEGKETKAEAKMPVFTRKMKAQTDSSQQIQNIPQQHQYDLSKMKMSAPSSKPAGPRPEGEEGKPRTDGDRPRGDGDRPRGDGAGRGRGRGGYERGGDRGAFKTDEKSVGSDDSWEDVKDKRKPTFTRGSKNFSKE